MYVSEIEIQIAITESGLDIVGQFPGTQKPRANT